MTADILTMMDHPRVYLKNRANRLARLAELNAPAVVIENEFRLVEQAMAALRVKEGDTRGQL